MNNYLLPVFKVVAFLEGLSYLLLLFIAVPIKYLADDPTYVKLLGMPHGVLFIAYVGLAIYISQEMNLNKKKTVWILLASVIPIASFLAHRVITRQ